MPRKMRFYLAYLHDWDSRLCVSINKTSQYRIINIWFRAVSRLGDGVFWYSLMLMMALFEHEQGIKPVVHMVTAGLLGTAIYKWLKTKTSRPRPYQVRQDIRLAETPLDYFSFPSGHTLHAMTFSMIAITYYPVFAVLLIPFTLMVAASRVILGLHYPSDVLAGAGIGALIGVISFELLTLI